MTALAITAAAIILIALLRFGLMIEYGEDGLETFIKAGPFKFRTDTHGKRKAARKKIKEKKAGSAAGFMDIMKAVMNTLNRLRRKLLIKELTLHYTAAGDDPVKTAMNFGAANAVFGMIIPPLEDKFRIKKRDLQTTADFNGTEPVIYARIIISIAVWEALYVFSALLPLLKPSVEKPDIKLNTAGKERKQ